MSIQEDPGYAPEPLGEHDPRRIDEQIAQAVASTYGSFYGFIMLAFPWEEPGTELANFDGPDAWQRTAAQEIDRQVALHGFDGFNAVEAVRMAVASGHGIGKSAFVSWLILWIMSTRPFCAGTVTANTLVQLETKTWAQLSKWHRLCLTRDWFVVTSTRNNLAVRCILKDSRGESLEKVWFCTGQTCDENKAESFAGQHSATSTSFFIFDEASAIPDIIAQVAEGGMTDGEPMFFKFGNPTRNSGDFYDCFYKLGKTERWTTYMIDSRSCKMTNKAEIAAWEKEHGEDSDFFRVRVRGVFPRAGSKQLIPVDLVRESARRQLLQEPRPAIVVGVDAARFGDDPSVIRTRIGRDARTVPPKRYMGLSTIQLADKVGKHVLETETRYGVVDAVMIEGAGSLGAGVIDILRHRGFYVVEVAPGGKAGDEAHYANKRTEMWCGLHTWMATEKGCIDSDVSLEGDLIQVEYDFTATNKMKLEPKKDMKKRLGRSPNDGDALALTFAAPVRKREGAGRVESTLTAYNELQGVPSHVEPPADNRVFKHDPFARFPGSW